MVHSLDLLKNDKGLIPPLILSCLTHFLVPVWPFPYPKTISALRTILIPRACLLVLCSLSKMCSLPPLCMKLFHSATFYYVECLLPASGDRRRPGNPSKMLCAQTRVYFTWDSPPSPQRGPRLPRC